MPERAKSTAAAPKAKLTEAGAIQIATTPLPGWDKENAKALDIAYAPGAIGFDASTAPLVRNGAAFVNTNQNFMAMKFDRVKVGLQKAQIISDDASFSLAIPISKTQKAWASRAVGAARAFFSASLTTNSA